MANVNMPPSIALASQRLTSLLLRFPAAAIDGVECQTLMRKYKDSYSADLDIRALGFDNLLAAMSTLLFDIVRVRDSEDTDNPVLAVEDSVAMTPTPDAAATWPSLYRALVEIVTLHGAEEKDARTILVSQLKPHLQRHWHGDFDETKMSYLTEGGNIGRMRKMKHLLEALLKWREQRVAFHAHSSSPNSRKSELDEALEQRLELVKSTKHNDLLLRCVSPHVEASALVYSSGLSQLNQPFEPISVDGNVQHAPSESQDSFSDVDSMNDSADLKQQMEALKRENEMLRNKNAVLQHHFHEDMMQKALFEVERLGNVFDDPSEPPPFEYSGNTTPSTFQTPSDFGCGSGSITPASWTSGPNSSGTVTPSAGSMTPLTSSMPQMTMVPTWFMMGDRMGIPAGIVQQACNLFSSHTSPVELFRPAQTGGWNKAAQV